MKKPAIETVDLFTHLVDPNSSTRRSSFFLANQDSYRAANLEFPFRNSFYGIGITYSGYSGHVQIGSATYPVQKGSLITIGPGTVSKWATDYTSEHDTVFFTEELFHRTIKLTDLTRLSFFKPAGRHVIMLEQEKQDRMKLLFDAVKSFQTDDAIIPGLVYAILQFAIQCHNQPRPTAQPVKATRYEAITQEFTTLLTQHFRNHRTVHFYADNLHITPKYLSEVLQQTTGKTAKEHITEFLVIEAKSLLKQTDMTVQEIASWLGYTDASYFTRLFKQQVSVSPLAYKQA